ncbi:hypothetical protein BSKO_09816 [Bryopsis sp. KO-2023]|nr:hypothetical protein BSKO_09816 [Bryopsis sp. KO-2023]
MKGAVTLNQTGGLCIRSAEKRRSTIAPGAVPLCQRFPGRVFSDGNARRLSSPLCKAGRRGEAPLHRVVDVSTPKEEQNVLGKLLDWGGKGLVVCGVALALALASPSYSEAARSGGRMGGSSFRSRSYTTSRSSSMPMQRSAPATGFGMNSFFFPGIGMGYGYGYGFGGGGLVNILILGFMFAVLIQVLQGMFGGGDEDDGGYYGEERVAVARVQVGLLGIARGLQKDLDRVARNADTSTPEGLQYILQETVLALNRNPEYCVYGAGQVKSTNDPEAAEQKFNELSLKERMKIQQETLSNVGGRSSKKGMSGPVSEGQNEYIVVTILVALEGGLDLPKVTNREELMTTLNRLGAVTVDQVMAVEVLWVPQDDQDSYTQEELLQEYPNLYNL